MTNSDSNSVVSPGSKVLVTGANGYIAIWLVAMLLEKGYSVRGTVRSESNVGYLKELFGSKYGEKFEVVVVGDITAEGAFDEAVKGVDAIQHVASPATYRGAKGPNDIIDPAIKGTTGILESALKYGKDVQSIVITSSVISTRSEEDSGVVDESNWNSKSIEAVRNLKPGDDWQKLGTHTYGASKALAEKAAWDFVKKNEHKIGWGLSIICPSITIGPVLQEAKKPKDINNSLFMFFAVLFIGVPKDRAIVHSVNWVDVRDVAQAHILAMERPEASGNRFIVSAGWSNWDFWNQLKRGVRSKPTPGPDDIVYQNTKGQKVLGIKYRDAETTLRDSIKSFQERGWLTKNDGVLIKSAL